MSIVSFLPNFSHKLVVFSHYFAEYPSFLLLEEGGESVYSVLNSNSSYNMITEHYEENVFINRVMCEYSIYREKCKSLIISYLQLILTFSSERIWKVIMNKIISIPILLENNLWYINDCLGGIQISLKSESYFDKESELINYSRFVCAINTLYNYYIGEGLIDHFSIKSFISNQFYNLSYTMKYLIDNVKTKYINPNNWLDINNQLFLLNKTFSGDNMYTLPVDLIPPSNIETILLDNEVMVLFKKNLLNIISKIKGSSNAT